MIAVAALITGGTLSCLGAGAVFCATRLPLSCVEVVVATVLSVAVFSEVVVSAPDRVVLPDRVPLSGWKSWRAVGSPLD